MSGNDKKIVIIGPVYPYKGGISHHTSLMFQTLSKEYETEAVTYKLQYPKFLFKKEQKDYRNDGLKINSAKYWINTANPFNWINSARKIRALKPGLVIMQWWHPYFAPCYWILSKLFKKIPLLFVCHNVFPHERFPFDKKLSSLVLKQGDYYLVHSKLDEKDLLTLIPDAKYEKIVLPTFNLFKIQNLSQSVAREQLGIGEGEKILLFFGFVKEYKGLKHLLDALPLICEKYTDLKLLVVGDFDGNKEDYLRVIEEHQVHDQVKIYDGYIPDKEVEKFFAACDLVVLPYESATQSGIVQIAYDFEKGVLVTNVGGLPEVVEHMKTGYIVKPKNSKQIADAVFDFYENSREAEFAKEVGRMEHQYSWDRILNIIQEFLQEKV